MIRTLLVVIALGMLVACSDMESTVATGIDDASLTAAQRVELAELDAVANAGPDSLVPFVPTDDWEEIHPGVWWREKVSEAGEVTGHSLHASGPAALRWVAEVHWPPRIAEVRQLIEDAGTAGEPTAALEARLRQYETLQERLRAATTRQGTEVNPQRCTPVANASAGPTTTSPGAKAYANARSCVDDSEVATEAEANGYWTANADNKPAGGYASASSAQYGTTGCWSYAGAVAPPSDYDQDYHGSCY